MSGYFKGPVFMKDHKNLKETAFFFDNQKANCKNIKDFLLEL